MVKTESFRGRAVLMVAHCAGMVDMVALPVWVGTLISAYKFDPQQAGGLVTLFLIGAVISSAFFAPRFNRVSGRVAAAVGFAAAALAFLGLSLTRDFSTMAALHAVAGIAAGCGLSFTHGTIGRSANPHRMFALVGIALGFFAVAFFAAMPQLIARVGGEALFRLFAAVMALAAVCSALGFPQPHVTDAVHTPVAGARLPRVVWFAVFGVACMALVQAMIFSFVERIGTDRGFGFQAVSGVLIALGLVNLTPSPLAVFLQKHWPAHRVVLFGPLAQAIIALTIALSTSFVPYAIATCLFAGVMIFTHNFAFGLLASLDTSGRAVAATPAMLMVGAAIGPVLGGTLVKAFGYGSLGLVAAVFATLAMVSFWRVRPAVAAAQAVPA